MADSFARAVSEIMSTTNGSTSDCLGSVVTFGKYRRTRIVALRQVMRDALTVTTLYVLSVWLLLAIFGHQIAALFGASPGATDLIVFFCRYGSFAWALNALFFVSIAVFNNLGYATYSTVIGWLRDCPRASSMSTHLTPSSSHSDRNAATRSALSASTVRCASNVPRNAR